MIISKDEIYQLGFVICNWLSGCIDCPGFAYDDIPEKECRTLLGKKIIEIIKEKTNDRTNNN